MDAINGVSQMHRARAQRITRAPGHKAGQIRLARNHFRRRVPIRPLGLAGDLQQASPGEAVATDPNAITQRARLTLDQVQVTFAGFDNNGASRVAPPAAEDLPEDAYPNYRDRRREQHLQSSAGKKATASLVGPELASTRGRQSRLRS